MADQAHRQTDKRLAKLEKALGEHYSRAYKGLAERTNEYFESFAARDAEQRRLLAKGDITREFYDRWRLNQIGRGRRFEALRDEMAERMTRINEIAAAYINDATPGIYSLNRNYAAYTIEQVAGDVGLSESRAFAGEIASNFSFTLFDEQTVKKLMVEAPDLMPYYPPERAVNRGIDIAWGKRQITAQVTQSILMGEDLRHMADRLQESLRDMNRTAAIRAARTATTAAQNAGRMDSYIAAEKMGLKLVKEWMATKDNRVRHDHAMADGQTVGLTEAFDIGGAKLMFPADPTGPANQTYNCRCTMAAKPKNLAEMETTESGSAAKRSESTNKLTYSEWEQRKKDLQGGTDKKLTKTSGERKPLQNNHDNDIMKRKEMKQVTGQPMEQKDFCRVQKAFEKKDRLFKADDESERYCKARGATGITLNANTVLFVKNPSRAAVFEELIHTYQYRSGENDGSALSRAKAEVAAKEKLLKWSNAYKLTEADIAETKLLLAEDRKLLNLLTEVDGNEK